MAAWKKVASSIRPSDVVPVMGAADCLPSFYRAPSDCGKLHQRSDHMEITGPARGAEPGPRERLIEKSKELEAAFLSEMLAHAGLGAAAESFGGGIGEAQFASFLRDEQARALAERGGIGLAEHIFRSLARREGIADV
jgi:hypothetical protein